MLEVAVSQILRRQRYDLPVIVYYPLIVVWRLPKLGSWVVFWNTTQAWKDSLLAARCSSLVAGCGLLVACAGPTFSSKNGSSSPS